MSDAFPKTFKQLTGHAPFPWQQALFDLFVQGPIPESCNLPTGLGKTSVIAIWLIALAKKGAQIPRRMVYVVNRRTVVDQTTNEVEKLCENLLKPELAELRARLEKRCAIPLEKDKSPLAISTLRGQFADNREWSADPSRPAVICGTVDMIGSRLLFSGYGVGFKARPLHAGFLGQDSLLVHDEAHLEPAFQKLITDIEQEQKRERQCGGELPWPKLRVMELTATTRNGVNNGSNESAEPFTLTETEQTPPDVIPDPPTEPIHHVWRRLKAKKTICLHENKDEKKLAKEIAGLAVKHHDAHAAVLVFVRTLEAVKKVCDELTDKKNGVPENHIQQLTGTMRGLERDRMADPRLPDASRVFARFLKPPKSDAPESERWQIEPMPGTVYLVCTSAGEVGINISADHLVCDLSTFESMAQRFGRVNRYGDRDDTRIDVVYPANFDDTDKLKSARKTTFELLEKLNSDASPKALGELAASLTEEQRKAAFAPPPVIPPATDILFDAWSLTTIRDQMPGRPHVEPYLHGIRDWEPPETHVAWREEVEIITGGLLEEYDPQDLLDTYPTKPHELLRDRTDRIFKSLQTLAGTHADKPVWIVDDNDAVQVTTLGDITSKRQNGKDNSEVLHGMTILLPPSVGGLVKGLFDGTALPMQDESEDVADEWHDDKGSLRKRIWDDEPEPQGMILEREIKFLDDSEDEDAKPNTIWRWFVRKPESPNERGREAVRLQSHIDRAKTLAGDMVDRLELPKDIADAVVFAARFHDSGKDRARWQRSIGNDRYPDDVYAKSGRLPDGTQLRSRGYFKDYRHEFGSLLDIEKQPEFQQLDKPMQDLVRHLIAAHHGYARPHFPPDNAYDPESQTDQTIPVAIEVPRRFARLQRRYGRWGLAYLESLLRAADWAASASPSPRADEPEVKR